MFTLKLWNKFGVRHATLWGFLLVFLASFFFRDAIVSRDLQKLERDTGAHFAPYLVESAIMKSYIERVANGESISGIDPALPAMPHRTVAEQMSLGLEYVGGYCLRCYRLFHGVPDDAAGIYETSYDETRFLRKMLTLHMAWVPALLFLLLRILHVPWFAALCASLVETVSAAALGRYTGQDLIKGAFAFPFLTGYLVCMTLALRGRFHQRQWALSSVAATVFLAAAAWDEFQLLPGVLAILECLRRALGGSPSLKRRKLWLMTALAFALAAILIPYSRAHGTFFSPVLQFAIMGALLLNWIPRSIRAPKLQCWGMIAGLGAWSLLLAQLSPFSGNYQHFSSLLWAKLRFWNTLPADPSSISFDVRFLWTPELHSADWNLCKIIFPAAFPVLILLTIYLAIRRQKLRFRKPLGGSFALYAMLAIANFITFLFFARFRDFTMLMTAPALGLGIALALRNGRKTRVWFWYGLILLVLVMETAQTFRVRRAYPQGLKATAELVKTLRKYDLNGKTILADMQISPLLKGYCRASILIQPKYELPEVRALMKEYLETLFRAPIKEFEAFCAKWHVDYVLLHVPMVMTPMQAPYSYRYMTCTEKLPRNSAAAILAMGKNGMAKNFTEITLPAAATGMNGYRLYYFIPPKRRTQADELSDQAMEAYYTGNAVRAVRLIQKAYLLAPGLGNIYERYVMICQRPPLPPELPRRAVSNPVQP